MIIDVEHATGYIALVYDVLVAVVDSHDVVLASTTLKFRNFGCGSWCVCVGVCASVREIGRKEREHKR